MPLALQIADPSSLINRKIFTRWPDDNNFYEATITNYDPATVSFKIHYYLLLDVDTHLCHVASPTLLIS
jgi:hypothetical protein